MLLDHRLFFVKERVGLLKLVDTFDILDPATNAPIGIAREEVSGWVKYLRLLVNKRMLPTVVNVYDDERMPPVLTMRRPFTFFRSVVTVTDRSSAVLGTFRSKLFSLGGGFWVHDHTGQQVAEVKGDWKGWNFRFLVNGGSEVGTVTKKWAGVGRELFTSADNYVISVPDGGHALNGATVPLLLAAGLALDIVFKEKN